MLNIGYIFQVNYYLNVSNNVHRITKQGSVVFCFVLMGEGILIKYKMIRRGSRVWPA